MTDKVAKKNSSKFTSTISDMFGPFFKQNLGILIGLLVIFIIFSIISPAFLTKQNLLTVLRTTSSNIYLACGMTMVIILGGIDLSVGAIIAFAGVFAVGMIQWFNVPIPIGIISGILIGLVFGLFNGFVVAKTTIPPFIVTLATMNIARGAAYVFTGGQPVTCMSNSFISFGSGYLFGIPLPVIYFIIIVIISSIILNNTKMGRYILATGGNLEAAEYSGIKIGKVKLFTYAFSGLLAGFAGVVLASRMYSGQPTAGNGAELDAIAAVVLGGTSMMGGSGTIGGTIIGALVIGVLNNGQDLMNINSFWQYIVKGVVILLAVYVDFIKQKKSSFA